MYVRLSCTAWLSGRPLGRQCTAQTWPATGRQTQLQQPRQWARREGPMHSQGCIYRLFLSEFSQLQSGARMYVRRQATRISFTSLVTSRQLSVRNCRDTAWSVRGRLLKLLVCVNAVNASRHLRTPLSDFILSGNRPIYASNLENMRPWSVATKDQLCDISPHSRGDMLAVAVRLFNTGAAK
jgi:hypothetical protein